jgi:TonB family protein
LLCTDYHIYHYRSPGQSIRHTGANCPRDPSWLLLPGTVCRIQSKHRQFKCPPVVFIESQEGKRYTALSRFLFYLSSKREYLVDGVVAQKYLPEKTKAADYRRVVGAAWPDMDPKDLKRAAKQVQAWVKKHSNAPLLLVNGIRREKPPGGSEDDPLEVPGRVQESKLIRRVQPIYPDEAKRKRLSGRVVLAVAVDQNGSVEEIIVKSGHPLLAAASILAVQQWKYSPTLINGKPVPVVATVTTVFNVF